MARHPRARLLGGSAVGRSRPAISAAAAVVIKGGGVVLPTPTPTPTPTPSSLSVYVGAAPGTDLGAFSGTLGAVRAGSRLDTGDGYTTQLFTVTGGRLLAGGDL